MHVYVHIWHNSDIFRIYWSQLFSLIPARPLSAENFIEATEFNKVVA